jgi:hypothetical protein
MNAQIITAILDAQRIIPTGCESIHAYGEFAADADFSDVHENERDLITGDYINGDQTAIHPQLYFTGRTLRSDVIRAALAL